MKKKLNLLWNLKFNFFSVAERPLTFFAYFLNAKKVGRRRLVIVPAKAGDFPLFPHAASVPAPALAPIRSHFACGETARPVVASAGAGTGSRVWEKRKVPRFRGADYEICRWRYFLNVKKVTKEHRGRSVRLKNHDFKFRIKS